MSRLLERSFLLDRSLGRRASVLIPAEKWLFDFYRQFEYEPVFMLNTKELSVSACHNLSMLGVKDASSLNVLYEDLLKKERPFLVRDAAEWEKQIKMFSAIGMGCFGKHAPNGELLGYAFAWKSADSLVYVQEIAASSENVQMELLEGIAAAAKVNRVRYSDTSCSCEPIGCMKRYDNQRISTCYMNLMLN